MRHLAVVPLLILCVYTHANAWTDIGHVIITRAANQLILNDDKSPAELKQVVRHHGFVRYGAHDLKGLILAGRDARFAPLGLEMLSVMPDVTRASENSMIRKFGAPEGKMHYLDAEYFLEGDLPQHPITGKAVDRMFAALPDDPTDPRYVTAGYVTFRIQHCYRSLIRAMGRSHPQHQHLMLYWWGYLSHYVSDLYQPHHTTFDYKSHSYLDQISGQKPNLHLILEHWIFQTDQEDRTQYRQRFYRSFMETLQQTNPPLVADPYELAVEIARQSYHYLEPLGQRVRASIDANRKFDATMFFSSPKSPEQLDVLRMQAQQMAKAAVCIKALVLKAYQQKEPQK